MTFAGRLAKAQNSSFGATKDELVTFLTANPTFTFKTTSLDHFVATNKINMSPAALSDAKKIQRLHRVTENFDAVEALNKAGLDSAQSIYEMGREPFLAQMTPVFGSISAARTAFARAQVTYAMALTAYGNYNLALNATPVAAMAPAAPSLNTALPAPSPASALASPTPAPALIAPRPAAVTPSLNPAPAAPSPAPPLASPAPNPTPDSPPAGGGCPQSDTSGGYF